MGLDGFSMANLGLYNKLTSAQMSNEVDLIAARGSENQIKDIDSIAKRKGIERKEFDYSQSGGQAFLGEDSSSEALEDENTQEAASQDDLTSDDEQTDNDLKRYEIRINSEADVAELYDNYLGTTVQRLTIKDMLSMASKFDDPSGVLVNKKI